MAQLNPNGSVGGNAQNIPEAHVPRTRSRFPLKRHMFNTHRFGEYIPHFAVDLNKDEDFPINSSGSLRTYTLKSPLMQNLDRRKDYFLVPMEAILPNNWEKFFDNPVRGDDVLDDVGPTVENFWAKVYSFHNALDSALGTLLSDTSTPDAVAVQAAFRYLILMEYFYSNGNLLSSLVCHGGPYCDCLSDNNDVITFDDYFDSFCNALLSAAQNNLFTLQVDGYTYYVDVNPNSTRYNSISLHHALQLMRDNPTFVISNPSTFLTRSVVDTWFGDWTWSVKNANVHCNLSRLWAYQLSIAHYMTNDHIDFVYSAELYRQLIGYYCIGFDGTTYQTPASYFTRNGNRYMYDYLSAHMCSLCFTKSTSNASSLLTATSGIIAFCCLGYWSALLGYRRSLRYLDYFTGSRAQPLAVYSAGTGLNGGISTDVGVVSNQVSVIDITKSIQAQRFLNSVNRVRHNFEGYLKGIFGGEVPAPDYHNPFKLAYSVDTIFGQETENTGSAQLAPDGSTDKALKIAVTTNLRGSGKYAFEIHTDRPCIAIGITSYEIARVYQKGMDRSFLHLNRFDWFNPFMQYIGDQPVYLQELGISPLPNSLNSLNSVFAYTIRHEEYKQWWNTCAGGFCVPSTDLDNWIFVANDQRGNQTNINPDWIRALSAEFDRFYLSLSGYSLGTYFHFIVDDYNTCKASRPMAFAPQILG